MSVELSVAQEAALSFAEGAARERESDALARLDLVLHDARCTSDPLEEALETMRAHARVVLHFHPDRYGRAPLTVAESLLADGCYRNQFETGLSADPPRDRWERDLFGGAYHQPGVAVSERPRYGALELIRYPDGPIPRFGSCYFVLKQDVTRRATLTFGGSERAGAVERFGTMDAPYSVMAALLEEVSAGARAKVPWPPYFAPTLGVPDLTVRRLLDRLVRELPVPRPDPGAGPAGRVLDSVVEAHVHGPIDLRDDVELLVVDPAFRDTPTGDVLADVCQKYEIARSWHCGFSLRADGVPEDFRGRVVSKLAQRVAVNGDLDAAAIGRAEASVRRRARDWEAWGSEQEVLQMLKQLWHVLVHYGEPVA